MMSSVCKSFVLALLATAATAPFAAAADRAATVDEVVVTATKRSENIQSVPVSITALSGQTLERVAADRLEDYTRMAPGLIYASNGSNSGTFEIRGLNTSTLAGNTQSPVAVYYDDLPALNSFAPLVAPDLRLFDIERIEVLRGPQGTLFGSGSLGGAIRVITNKPDLSGYHAKVEASATTIQGGSAGYGLSGMANLPLAADRLAVRLVGYYRRDGGWVDNPVRGETNVNTGVSYGGRLMARFEATPDFTLSGQIAYQNDKPDDSAYTLYGGPPTVEDSAAPQRAILRGTTYNLVGEYRLGGAVITSSTTYFDQQQSISRDYTKVGVAALGVPGPSPFTAFGPSKAFAQELRIASPSDQRLRWLAGAFFLHNDRILTEDLLSPGAGAVLAPFGFPSDHLFLASDHLYTTERAVFGEVNYDVTDRFTVTLGARAFSNSLHVVDTADGILVGGHSQVSRSNKESKVTPKAVLTYHLNPDVMVYAQAAEGYRVGGSGLAPTSDPLSGAPIPSSYGPDSLWNYEAGLKSTLLGGKLRLNAALYSIQWKGIQLQARSASGFVYITNAGDASSKGAEVEARLRPTENWELGAALSFNSATLDSLAPGAIALVGDRLPGAPRFTASNYVQYQFDLPAGAKGYARVDHSYMSKAYSDLTNPTALVFGGFSDVDARIGANFGRYEVMAYVTNIANGDGMQNAVFLPNGPSAIRQRPRTFGLTLRAGW